MRRGLCGTQLGPWHPGPSTLRALLAQQLGEPSVGNGPHHQPGLTHAARKVPTQGRAQTQAEEMAYTRPHPHLPEAGLPRASWVTRRGEPSPSWTRHFSHKQPGRCQP